MTFLTRAVILLLMRVRDTKQEARRRPDLSAKLNPGWMQAAKAAEIKADRELAEQIRRAKARQHEH